MIDFRLEQRICLLLTICFIPFEYIPISIPLIGNQLFPVFLIIGYVLFMFEIFLNNYNLKKWEVCGFCFLITFTSWNIISNVIGVLDYPFWEYIDLTQMDTFKNLYDNIYSIFPIEDLVAMKGWLLFKAVRYALSGCLFSYTISLWIYHIYRDNWKRAFEDLRKATIILCCILCLYSVFEIDYLTGGTIGKAVLKTLTPLYLKIETIHGWWPPLLWNGQLRSLFAEPSFFGIYTAMAIPIVSSYFFEKEYGRESIAGMVIYFVLIIMLTLSKARTATALFSGELFLLVLYVVIFKRELFKRLLILLVCSGFAFSCGLYIMSQFKNQEGNITSTISVESYVTQNIASITGDKRSNSARFANVRATVLTGLQHPLFGVGHGLKDMYIDNNLSVEDKKVGEVKKWSKYMYEKGPLKSSYPPLNQLAGVLVESGMIGLFSFLLPILGVLYIWFRYRFLFEDVKASCLLISFLGLCGAFFSHVATIEFYILIGFMMVALKNIVEDKNEQSNDK